MFGFFMIVFEPEESIKAVAVYTQQAVSLQSEEAGVCRTFNINTFPTGINPGIPLVYIVARRA